MEIIYAMKIIQQLHYPFHQNFFLNNWCISIISVIWLIIIGMYLFKIIPNKPQHANWKFRAEIAFYLSALLYGVFSFMWLIIGFNVYFALPIHGMDGVNCKQTPSGKMLLSWLIIRCIVVIVGIILLCMNKLKCM